MRHRYYLSLALLAAAVASTCASIVRPAPRTSPFATARSPREPETITRLPPEVIPKHYDIEITPYFQEEDGYQPNEFQGEVTIHANVSGTLTDTITMHAASTLNISDVTVTIYSDGVPTDVPVQGITPDSKTETITINLVTEISGPLTIHILFVGQLSNDMDGFYVSTYNSGNEIKYLAATQFEPTSARKAFPCFDEPALKSTFTVTLYPPDGYGAIFNTEVTEEQPATTTEPLPPSSTTTELTPLPSSTTTEPVPLPPSTTTEPPPSSATTEPPPSPPLSSITTEQQPLPSSTTTEPPQSTTTTEPLPPLSSSTIEPPLPPSSTITKPPPSSTTTEPPLPPSSTTTEPQLPPSSSTATEPPPPSSTTTEPPPPSSTTTEPLPPPSSTTTDPPPPPPPSSTTTEPSPLPSSTTTEPPPPLSSTTTEPPPPPSSTTIEPPLPPSSTTTEPPLSPSSTTTDPPPPPSSTTTEPPLPPSSTTDPQAPPSSTTTDPPPPPSSTTTESLPPSSATTGLKLALELHHRPARALMDGASEGVFLALQNYEGTSQKNLQRLRSVSSRATRKPVKFTMTHPMSTYLVAFVVYDKESFTPYPNSTHNQRVWSRIELVEQREYAFQVGSSSLEAYGSLFPKYFEYMNDKLDQVAIPDFSAGAMENWGLVTYRERALLIDNKESTTRSRCSVLTTIAHELSHQWFGDLVSPNFWNYLWLNEGFATYWSYFVNLDSLTDGWSLREQFLAEEMSAALDSDALADTHAMTTPNDTLAPFDDISYSKGGVVLRMFSEWIGEETFYSRLNTYLEACMYDSATPSDLFSALADGDADLESSMEAWTTKEGYPVINVTRDGTTATLTQNRYLLSPPDAVDDSDDEWPINVTYVSGPDLTTSEKSFILNSNHTIEDLADGQPLYLNYKWTGFYRVNYDSASWELIRQQLSSGHDEVPKETRAQLLSDAFSLARSGHIDYSLALQNSRYLEKETDYLPWAVAFRAFDFLDTVLAPTDHYNSFKTYMRKLLDKTYSANEFSEFPEDYISRLHRVNVLEHACAAGHSPCVESANALAADAERVSIISVEPDLRSTVYCVWAQDNELWEGLWQRYFETNVATEKVEILSALGCSQNNDTLAYYLQNATNHVRPQDWQTVYAGVYSTPVGLNVALDFIRTNAQSLMSQPSILQKIISGIATKVVTKAQLEKLMALEDVLDMPDILPTITTALATADAQVKWVENNVHAIGSWLDNEVKPEPSPAPLSARVSHTLLGAAALLVYLAVGLM